MKRTISVILLVFVFMNIASVDAFAEEGRNWYIRRNGNSQPQICDEHKLIEKYNSYYIDKRLNDDSSEKKIYLTFDAGYENGNVEKILDILKDKNVPAAFFLLDHIILKNTDVVLRMSNEGHLVCNHTRNHADVTKFGEEQIIKNLSDLEKIYEQKTGKQMAKYFRFPEGRYSEEALAVINKMGYKTIFWSFGYADWDNAKQPNTKKALELILNNTHNGEVVLLHPTSETNVLVLPLLIDEWRKLGYLFGTLDELTA